MTDKVSLSEKQQQNLIRHNEKQKFVRNLKRDKKCQFCQTTFFDTTKRIASRTCSKKCAYDLGVTIRTQKGSYTMKQEQKDKISKTMKDQYALGERPVMVYLAIEELKKKSRRTEINDKIKQTCLKKYGVDHWTKTKEGRELTRKNHKGRQVTTETREKLSVNSRKQIFRFSKCRGGFRQDLNQYFRSSWEANYARYLNHLKIKWEYEIKTFELEKGYTYTPDFKINDEFIELKGWLTEKGKTKLDMFKVIYPGVKLTILGRNEYKILYDKYSETIPNWEKIRT